MIFQRAMRSSSESTVARTTTFLLATVSFGWLGGACTSGGGEGASASAGGASGSSISATGTVTTSASGTGGAGGGGGSATPPPTQVLPCDAVGAVGEWQNILPTVASVHEASSLAVDPVNAGVVYLGSSVGTEAWGGPGQGIYKSSDCGSTWTKVNTGVNAAVIDSGVPWGMTIDPIDPQVLYETNGYGTDDGLFKTVNGGVDWERIYPPLSDPDHLTDVISWPQVVAMDPGDHLHLLLSMHDTCKGAYAPSCMAESLDAGATWRLFKLPTLNWSHSAGAVILDAHTWLYASGADGLFRTTDGGATWEKVGDSAFPQMIRATDGSYLIGSLQGLLRSADGHAWSPIANTGAPVSVMGDGYHLFALREYAADGQPYVTASESDPTSWAPLQTPDMTHGGHMQYDPHHRILYSANWLSGLWRVVTH